MKREEVKNIIENLKEEECCCEHNLICTTCAVLNDLLNRLNLESEKEV